MEKNRFIPYNSPNRDIYPTVFFEIPYTVVRYLFKNRIYLMCNVIVRLIPNAKKSGIASLEIPKDTSDTIHMKIKVTATPQKGKANKAMLAMLAKKLALSKSSLRMLSKQSSPLKIIYIDKDCKEITELLQNNDSLTL
ncbi:DUF167 family protein [Candidatus Liberibacter asiaticus]|nr:DUF167 family protein [Candidatus Liberibacter asiaticus]AGH16471.1 hypothetical protein WSI_00495 [Candidatus Liberibacter asiaticus str. gxpsy]KRF68578.1 hypothetical protein AQ620_03905 [Candidatus Liberibacter asiaticus]WCM57513.1 DUF167 family protein [Candidatus Liberibacter asiaticus]WGV38895.1 DUF167 family protein [Candidatus Liberibacter asiaticus]WLD01496.1 DUF167 family protein [Candidatus Liberibacter asiaticus]